MDDDDKPLRAASLQEHGAYPIADPRRGSGLGGVIVAVLLGGLAVVAPVRFARVLEHAALNPREA